MFRQLAWFGFLVIAISFDKTERVAVALSPHSWPELHAWADSFLGKEASTVFSSFSVYVFFLGFGIDQPLSMCTFAIRSSANEK